MGKKKPEVMAQERERFVEGAVERGTDRGKAGDLFDLIVEFAGYGFPKAHSTAYALITYQTAYLKANHPREYLAAVLTIESGNNDRPASVGIRPWLGRCVKSQARMFLRGERRRKKRERIAARSDLQAGAPTRADEVEAALAGLKPKEREAVVLRYMHDFDYREIGFVLGMHEGAVRVCVHRALQRVRKRLGITLPVLLALLATSKGVQAAPTGVSAVAKAGVVCALLATVSLAAVTLTGEPAAGGFARTERAAADNRPGPTLAVNTETGATVTDQTVASPSAQVQTVKPLDAPPVHLPGMPLEQSVHVEPDAITRRYLDELVAEYRRQTTEKVRARILRLFGGAHREYLKRTGDTTLLPFLQEVIQHADSERERSAATGSLVRIDRPEVIRLMAQLVGSKDVGVRRHAAMALSSSRDESVWPSIERALGHEDKTVRWNLVMGMSTGPHTEAREDALLDRLATENEPRVAELIVKTLQQRWGVARDRVQGAVDRAPEATRAALLALLSPN